jgi:hypothetical protein
MEASMPKEQIKGQIKGQESEFTEEDRQREQFGLRGVAGEAAPAKMAPQRDKKTPKDNDPGRTA